MEKETGINSAPRSGGHKEARPIGGGVGFQVTYKGPEVQPIGGECGCINKFKRRREIKEKKGERGEFLHKRPDLGKLEGEGAGTWKVGCLGGKGSLKLWTVWDVRKRTPDYLSESQKTKGRTVTTRRRGKGFSATKGGRKVLVLEGGGCSSSGGKKNRVYA